MIVDNTMNDPTIEVTAIEFLQGMSANAQATIAASDWMLDCAHRTRRHQGTIPPWPSDEIDGPRMRCACEGRSHAGHPEHIGALAGPEQQAVAYFLVRLDAETPINYDLAERWLSLNMGNASFHWHKDRDPPVWYNEKAYSWHYYSYRFDAESRRTKEQLLSQASADFCHETEQHNKWLRDTERLSVLSELVRRMAPDAPKRRDIESDIKQLQSSVEYLVRFGHATPPKLRTLEEQRDRTVADAVRGLADLRRQVEHERRKIAEAVAPFRKFLAELNPADW